MCIPKKLAGILAAGGLAEVVAIFGDDKFGDGGDDNREPIAGAKAIVAIATSIISPTHQRFNRIMLTKS
jgi:hypothetical protein